jgi:hypothetical protein
MVTKNYANEHEVSDDARKEAIETSTHFCWEEDVAWVVGAWELRHLWDSLFQYGDYAGNPDKQEKYLKDTLTYWYPRYSIQKDLIDPSEWNEKVYCPGHNGNYCGDGFLDVKLDKHQCVQVVCRNCGRVIC